MFSYGLPMWMGQFYRAGSEGHDIYELPGNWYEQEILPPSCCTGCRKILDLL